MSQTATFRFTRIDTKYPASKVFRLVDGCVVKEPAKPIGSGKAEIVETDLQGLLSQLEGFKENQVLALGVPGNGQRSVKLTTAKKKEPGAIPRNREHFTFDELALLPLDYDQGTFESTKEFDAAMSEVLSGFADAERFYRQSATAGIYHGDKKAFPALNFHGYILIKVDSDPGKAIRQLQKLKEIVKVRAWLAGHGYLFISQSGSVEKRCLVDLAPWARPEGIMYEGRPAVGKGLEYRQQESRYVPGKPYLNMTDIPQLSDTELSKYRALTRKETARQLPKINKVRREYGRQMVDTLVAGKQVSRKEAEKMTAHAMNLELSAMWPVALDDGRVLLIKDLIEEPDEFEGVSMADPIEPDYGKCKAKFYYNNGQPIINSHAHGGRIFKIGNFENETPNIELAHEGAEPITAPEQLTKLCREILDSRCPTGSFDLAQLPPVLADYVSDLSQTTNADPIMITQSVLCTASAYLKKSIFLPETITFTRLYPNLWCLAVIKSGGFKSTALHKGMRFALDIEDEINEAIEVLKIEISDLDKKKDAGIIEANMQRIAEKEHKTLLFPSKITPESLIEQLADGYGGMIVLNEFGEWLKNFEKSHNSDLKASFTNFYDCPPNYKYYTKNHGKYTIRYPYLTISAATALKWLSQSLDPSDVEAGFFARFLIFAPPPDNQTPPAFPQLALDAKHLSYKKFTESLRAAVPDRDKERELSFSPGARSAFHTIHDSLYREKAKLSERNQEILEPYIKRWNPYIQKIAMILQVFLDPHNDVICEDAILSANAVVQYAIKSTTFIFQEHLDKSPMQIKMDSVLRYIAGRDGCVNRLKLLASRTLDGGHKDYDYTIDSLLDAGRLAVDQTGDKKDWKYSVSGNEFE